MDARIESLEVRSLLSAWSTVDSFPASSVQAMAADSAGNVYAAEPGLVREKPAAAPDAPGSWTTLASLPGVGVEGIAVDANGNIFLTGHLAFGGSWSTPHFATWELPKGSGSAILLDDAGAGVGGCGIALDSAGNVYAVGRLNVATRHGTLDDWTVRKGTYDASTGAWSFATVDQLATNSEACGVSIVTTTINGAPSTGVYVAGTVGSSWVVRKSADGGRTWNQVDSSPVVGTTTLGAQAFGVAGDLAGDVYVDGTWTTATPTGSGPNKKPIYSYSQTWTVRKSTDGGATWSTDNSYSYPLSSQTPTPRGIGADSAGNMYAIGYAYDSANVAHAIIRSNAGGSWATVDDYMGASGTGASYRGFAAFAVDSGGNLYAGGGDNTNGWMIRSAQGAAPAATGAAMTPAASAFSPTQITGGVSSLSLFDPTHDRRRPGGLAGRNRASAVVEMAAGGQ